MSLDDDRRDAERVGDYAKAEAIRRRLGGEARTGIELLAKSKWTLDNFVAALSLDGRQSSDLAQAAHARSDSV